MAGRSKKQHKPYDDAFKLLAEQDAEALLLLLGEIKPGEPVKITPIGRELRAATRLPDQAYKVVTATGARIVHIEAQTSYDQLMPERMADYGVREWLQYRLPVTCYVLLLTDRGLPERAPRVGRIEAGDVQITVRYRLIRLSQISATRMLAWQRNNLLPFVPLMRGGEAELKAGARRLRRITEEKDQSKLGFDFLILGALRYNRADLLDLIGGEDMLPLRVYKESPMYEFLIEEGKDRWKEEGIKEGELKSAAEMLRLLIAKRFPQMKATQKIKRIRDAALLRQLCLEMIEIPDANALRKRLDEAIKSQGKAQNRQ